jgi:hypothetical protein
MSEEIQPPQTPTEEKEKKKEESTLGFDIMSYLGQGSGLENLDPLTRWMLIQEMLDDWRERRSYRRNPQTSPQPDLEKLMDKMNETWEKRFLEYQSRIESLILGRKVEEAEKRAEEAEKKLKEFESAKQQEELMKAKIVEATAPLQDRIKELQSLITMKTANMTNEEKKSFFQNLGEEIEKTIGEEVTGAIAGTIKDSLLKTFSGKEEPPITPEGKINWIKMADKWISKSLDAVNNIFSRLPPRTPPQRQITTLPETALPPAIAAQQPAETAQPETVPMQPPEATQPEEAKEIKEATEEVSEEKTVEEAVPKPSSEETRESPTSQEPQQTSQPADQLPNEDAGNPRKPKTSRRKQH